MGFVKLNKGEDIYYRLLPGETHLPHLVFLHEGLGCVGMWKEFPERLCRATGCPGLVYDREGFGKSSPSRQPRTVHYIHRNALVELFAVLEKIIPNRAYILVGHSDGASIALIHASENPPLLSGVVAEAPHVMVETKTLEGIRETVCLFNDRKHNALSRYHGPMAGHVFAAWHDIWLSKPFQHWNIEYLLPSVRCPCLILQGKRDPYGTDRHAQLIASKICGPVQLELIDDCGHAPHHEAAGRVLGLMATFIRKNSTDATPSAELDPRLCSKW